MIGAQRAGDRQSMRFLGTSLRAAGLAAIAASCCRGLEAANSSRDLG